MYAPGDYLLVSVTPSGVRADIGEQPGEKGSVTVKASQDPRIYRRLRITAEYDEISKVKDISEEDTPLTQYDDQLMPDRFMTRKVNRIILLHTESAGPSNNAHTLSGPDIDSITHVFPKTFPHCL